MLYFFFFHCSTLSFSTTDYLKHVLGLVKSFMDFLSSAVFFFLSLLYSFLFNLRLSKTRYGPCKVVGGFFKGSGVFFFFHCSTLSFSTTDYLKHVLYLVK